ncbi:glucose 1-dehydrogenase [Sphingobium aromaticivastans]|uniref:SDR family NAD(P)-dependent oxidoreductase n=1 Tax=Sphingobium aromaticivastans TaxID=1778665 RepID=UPI00301632D9
MIDLTGKSVIITGAASGIGRATAILAASLGANLTLGDRTEEAGASVVDEIEAAGGTAQFVRCDVAQEDDVEALVAAAVSRYGQLDGALNNAGRLSVGKDLHDLTWDEIEQVYAVNVKGVFLCMKYEIRELLRTGGGSIVNTASGSSVVAFPRAADYVSSKHAVLGLTRAAALDYAQHNIRVNCVMPGTVLTPMLEGLFESAPETKAFLESRIPMGRLAQPEEMAGSVIWMLSNQASYVTGAAISVDGGYTTT